MPVAAETIFIDQAADLFRFYEAFTRMAPDALNGEGLSQEKEDKNGRHQRHARGRLLVRSGALPSQR
jgi:hypothetical protein